MPRLFLKVSRVLGLHWGIEDDPSFGDIEAQYTIRSQNVMSKSPKFTKTDRRQNLRPSSAFGVADSMKQIELATHMSMNDPVASWDISSFGGQTIRQSTRKQNNREKIENFWATLENLYLDYPADKIENVLKLSTTNKSIGIESSALFSQK